MTEPSKSDVNNHNIELALVCVSDCDVFYMYYVDSALSPLQQKSCVENGSPTEIVWPLQKHFNPLGAFRPRKKAPERALGVQTRGTKQDEKYSDDLYLLKVCSKLKR